MLGLCFFVGGINRIEQYFNTTVAQTICTLLFLATVSIVIPTAAHSLKNTSTQGLTQQSRGTAIVIIVSYFLYLYFQLKSNRDQYSEPEIKVKNARYPKSAGRETGEVTRAIAAMGGLSGAPGGPVVKPDQKWKRPIVFEEEEEDDECLAKLSYTTSIILLVISTTLMAFNSEFAANSIQSLLTEAKLSKTFIGLVILPILNVDPICLYVARKDKLDLSIALTLEKCMQTALMVVPFLVLLGWWMGIEDMTLDFDAFPVLTLFISIVIVSYVVADGKSNWYGFHNIKSSTPSNNALQAGRRIVNKGVYPYCSCVVLSHR
jgi:Ca2+:H+ antiporter